jgi:hypothetical protein
MTSPHPRWDPDRFFWAVLTVDLPPHADLQAPGVRASLDAGLEPHVPIPIEQLATAYMKLGDGKVLACAVSEAAARREAPDAITLAPARLPPWLEEGAAAGDPGSMNVLTGANTPSPVRAAERKQQLVVAAAIMLAAGLVCVGLERRLLVTARALDEARESVRFLEQSSVVGALPPGPQPVRQRVFTELNRLRATRAQAARSGVSDAAALLEPVLRRWPADARARATDVSVAGTSLTLSAIANSPAEAERLVAAYAQTPGWQAPRSEITAVPGSTAQRVRLTMTAAVNAEVRSP